MHLGENELRSLMVLNWRHMLNRAMACFGIMIVCMLSQISFAESDRSLLRKALDKAVELKCQSELQQSAIFKGARFLMTEEAAENSKQQICACVGENALNDVQGTQILKATFNEEEKNQLVKQAIVNSLRHCTLGVLKPK